MPLNPGARLGPYVILGPLGAGGMGEVYKARDERLERTVAIKVLPEAVAADASLRARFEREARAIAAFSHPHICTIHDVGRQPLGAGPAVDFIVMEFLDGETLADRLARTHGPLPIEQVVTIGAAIADALDRAHRAGIVHRDLKPANVMLTKSGPKLLDFGLAKAIVKSGVSNETTKALTDAHTILGTIYYMAPEQVEGREADARSDIWALGAMLYEMATGERPFAGESTASVMSAILRDSVPLISTRQPLAPASFDHIVERCLHKDPDERWQSAGDVKRQLQWIASGRSANTSSVNSAVRDMPSLPPSRRWWWIAAACLAGGVALGAAPSLLKPRAASPPAPRAALSIVAPPNVRFGIAFSLSPDGRTFVFVGMGSDGPPRLYLRALSDTTARPIAGTEDGSYPFWSPRGDAIGFFASGRLKTIPIAGGVPRILASVNNGRGGSWGEDGTILFSGQSMPIQRVSDRGGAVTAVTKFHERAVVTGHRWPTFVNARQFVYAVQGGAEDAGLYLGSLDAMEGRKLNGAYSNSVYVDGLLYFVSNDMLEEQALDLAAGRLIGAPRDVVGPVTNTTGLGYAPFGIAANDTLAYLARNSAGTPSELVWLNREGQRVGALGADAGFGHDVTYNARLSRDGRSLVLAVFRAATPDLWLLDLERMAASRETFSDANDQMAVLSPAGDEMIFASNRDGPFNMYRKRLGGSTQDTRFLAAATTQYPDDWSRDGSTILYINNDPKTQWDIWSVGPDGKNSTPVLVTPFNEYAPRLSPDGHWIAYTSDESGRPEIYVQNYPIGNGKWQISTQGGIEPAWRGDGRELFYVAPNQTLNAVPIQTTPIFSAGRPVKLSETVIDTGTGGAQSTHYTVTADGQRFIANVAVANAEPPTILLNWKATAAPAAEK